jgi:hypothetical protein
MPVFEEYLPSYKKHYIGGLFTNKVKHSFLFVVIYVHYIQFLLLFQIYSCIKLKEYQSYDIDKFFCHKCVPVSGPTVRKHSKLHILWTMRNLQKNIHF